MSPKKRNKENKPLPTGWRYRYGAYYYRVPIGAEAHWDGKREFRLGKTLHEAHTEYAARIAATDDVRTMEQLCDRYTRDVLPGKKPATQKSNQYSLKRIRKAFNTNRVAAIKPVNIYAYRDHMGRTESKKKANLDLEVLSHMFTKAIEWGIIGDHPMTNKKVVKFKLEPRTLVPLEAEVAAFASILPEKWRLYVALKVWTGRRKGELLRVMKSHITDIGIDFANNKPPYDKFTLEWEPETRNIVTAILQLPGNVRGMHLFHTRAGKPYINDDGETSGFDSIWQRYITKALKDGVITRRFTEHDLRKVRPSQLSESQAQELLRHSNIKMTRVYRSKVIKMGK